MSETMFLSNPLQILVNVMVALIILISATVVLYIFFMVYRLSFPTIISYPWKMPTCEKLKSREKKLKVVMAGSFNPPHYGHLAMLSYLAERYGEVIVVVGMNPNKTYAVSPAQRAEFIQRMLDASGIAKKNFRVEVVGGYIWRYAMSQNAKLLFRGIRTWEKDGKEESTLHFLNLFGPIIYGPLKWPLPTHYMEGKPEYRHVSSTLVRDLCSQAEKNGEGVNLSELIPVELGKDIARAYSTIDPKM